MKRVSVSLFLVFLLMVFASQDSYAEKQGHSDVIGFQEEGIPMAPPIRHRGIEMMEAMPEAEHLMWRCLMDLGLDDKQNAEVKEIKSRVMKEMIKKRADEQIAHIELRDLLDKDSVDMKAIESKLKQIETVKTKMYLSLIKAREEVKSKLTPEQRKKFKETLEMGPMMRPPMMDRRYGHESHLGGRD
jgi:Spy/CpxP family protein refolding chaperone